MQRIAPPFQEGPSRRKVERLMRQALRASSPVPQRSGARVRIFNVKYSPNLGDGLLSECLEQALIECGTAPGTGSVDLAGRTAYGPGAPGRVTQMRLLDALPARLRHLAVRAPLAVQSRRLWRPHYRRALEEADCVVIGGGNLITDLDLNFPTKLALVADEAARRGLPVFIYGCGVSSEWSPRGRALLARALHRQVIRQVFVRDERSRQAWNDLAGTAAGLEATPVRDPGLLAAERYDVRPVQRGDGPPLIGINVTSQLALRYHSAAAPSPAQLDAWYLDLARSLVAQGCNIAVFTNGSPEDRACALRLQPAFQALGSGSSVRFPNARNPEELTHLIAGLSAIAAFRMHAIIAAYACAVPFLALAWDPKLDAFVQSVDRAHWLCCPAQTSGAAAASQLLGAMREGVPDPERKLVVAQTRRGIAMLQEDIARALAEK
ncbi:polysaccharide pyruvyl transferase family protein [Novosphingobium mangrovi (ex Huang et al. 2023)]|uniref:Polysaccharide pyruvyl transferase family protein n=1 Tax=Novosphingobium mangrovi (ex Huang et al. 2023) TaxID=2976432 RepID=A0ABT2I1M1_9SPHN|nr:polysaccharide pyruvyl transferase family protein [Novosphingobium mangrovi (ex Huang et al. 2023)]MCT2398705.1 polysaccharide pyruvyl transferase family protein [Novosphingobium mangrovi (ex Huang et al. 2023)]